MPAHKKKKLLASEELRTRLKLKHLQSKKSLLEKHPHVQRILSDKGVDLGKIREHSVKLLAGGAFAGSLLLSPPSFTKSLPPPQEVVEKLKTQWKEVDLDVPQKILNSALRNILPEKVRSLTREEEKYLEQVFENVIGIKARAALEGEHLNTTYGLIGMEQHLRRYPGDIISNHGAGWILRQGMAPGLGAWGYFAPSKEKLSDELVETEKWYAVVQTLYLPDWGRRQPYLRDWYKYRKVLIVNTDNGNAVVAAVADSGPAAWTGKHFGGSPEVMNYLGGPRYTKGPVIIFFVDDPDNKIPLGPVDYNKLSLPGDILRKV